MSLTESFHDLRERVDSSDEAIMAAADQRREEIEVTLEKARRDADTHAAELRSKTRDTAGEAENHWKEFQKEWDRHIEQTRQRVAAKKAGIDADIAEDQAAMAESDAMDALAFASSAVVEAEYAVIDAILARRSAKVLAQST
jgi:nucleosome binding factor SPN SPT16 subunit